MNHPQKIYAVVLAAGKGTRMKSEYPKVATPLMGKPLIVHVIESLKKAKITDVIVVVGYKQEVVKEILNDYSFISYAVQTEQLGTGHAVLSAEGSLKNFQGNILVCCGDVPMISSKSFINLIEFHNKNQSYATVLSAMFENPKGYGRLIRDTEKKLLEIVEEKDANEEQKSIKEINTGTYIFHSPSVFENLKSVGRTNAQNEYYLPDLIKIYNSLNQKTDAMILENSLESSGVNSPEDLSFIESLIKEGKLRS